MGIAIVFEPDMMNKNILFINYLKKNLGKYINFFEIDSEVSKSDGVLKIFVDNKDVKFVSLFLKNHSNCQFKQLMDVTAIDYPNRSNRFELMYNFLSVSKSVRLIVKSTVAENKPVNSLSALYSSAVWLEREVWDLFGIFFYLHPDLRRILTDYGFDGFPLRKDFPLTGYLEVRYDDEKKRIVQEPLEMSQEFRLFDFLSPWEKK